MADAGGTLVVVGHDRDNLDRGVGTVATAIDCIVRAESHTHERNAVSAPTLRDVT